MKILGICIIVAVLGFVGASALAVCMLSSKISASERRFRGEEFDR